MKVRAQIGMVLNLDKCIGCHTCSVTCKNVWTSRPGVEYAWFNNVETKPGIGYPASGRTRPSGTAAGCARNGSIAPRQGGKWSLLMRKIFANPNLPQIDDYYEPFTFDYEHLQSAPEKARPRRHGPRAQPDHGPAHGEDRMGSELGGNPGRRVRQAQPKDVNFEADPEGDLRPVREHLHDVPAAPVRALPEPGLRGVLPLGLDLQARGGRHRPHRPGQVPRLAHVRLGLPLQEDLLQLAKRQGREMHLLLPAHRGRPAHRLLRNLRGPHPLPGRAAVRRRPHRGSRQRGARPRSLPGPARHLPGPQ